MKTVCVCSAAVLTVLAAADFAAARATQPEAAAAASGSSVAPDARFLLSNERFHGDPEILWPGFLSGMRGFENFFEPIGQPLYFESPLINTNIRLLYIHHDFPEKSQIGGGDLHVFGAEARLAVTDRLAVIATKDGHSWLNAGILPEDDGWNDIAVGLKYALVADKENDVIITPGFRWEWSNGDNEVLQGNAQEWSPFVSVAKGIGLFHFMSNFTLRVPDSQNQGNTIFSWDAHFDYDLSELIPGFAPVLEFHGLHYLTDGTRFPLRVGAMDYDNIGSADVAGTSVFWVGVGGRFKLSPNASIGATYELPLNNRNSDILENRVTVDFTITW